MIRCLVIGDSHIPRRATEIPPKVIQKITDLSASENFDYTFFTGDEINAPKFMKFLNDITKKDVFKVIGNMDYGGNRDAPVHEKLDITLKEGDILRIGLTHGAQISPRGDHDQLGSLAAEKQYSILISGHTHHEEVFLSRKGTLLLNPGSATGAWSFVASGIPSFLILVIDDQTQDISVCLYRLKKSRNQLEESTYYFLFKNHQIQQK